MHFFIVLAVILLILILITISTTMIKVSLLISTRFKYDTLPLIIPGILYIILWTFIAVLWFITVNHFIPEGLISVLLDHMLKVSTSAIPYNILIVSAICYSIVGIILQVFVFLTVNIPYGKIKMALKLWFKKLSKFIRVKVLKKDEKIGAMPVSDIYIPEKWVRLTFLNSLVSSIFCYSLTLFCMCILLFIGNIASDKVLEKFNILKNEKVSDSVSIIQNSNM